MFAVNLMNKYDIQRVWKIKKMKHLLTIVLVAMIYPLAAQEGTPSIIRGSDKYSINIQPFDENTNEQINGVEIYVYETKSNKLVETLTTENGEISIEVDPQVEYEIRTCHPDYMRNGLSIYECNEGDEVLCSFGATEYNYIAAGGPDKPVAYFNAMMVLTPLKLGSVYELDKVYYDLDESHLRPDGKEELEELAKIMRRNKSIRIELSSHTDSRASDEYNMELSQRRAESCYDYLVSLGISGDRIVPKGYGESRLLNECADGVECTEEQHQKNRRTQVEVLAFEPVSCTPGLEMDFKVKDLKNDPESK